MELETQAANAVEDTNTETEAPATPDETTQYHEQTEQTAEPDNTTETTNEEPQLNETQRVSQRIKEVKEETERAWRSKIDDFVQRAYGSQGITNLDEYEAALQRAEYQEKYGVDLDEIKPLVQELMQNSPEFQELQELKNQNQLERDLSDLNKAFPELGINGAENIGNIPNFEAVVENVGRGLSLVDAYKLANFDTIVSSKAQKAQQDTISKISANGAASPGSLSQAAEDPAFFTEAQVRKMSARDVADNYAAIMKSRKKWNK